MPREHHPLQQPPYTHARVACGNCGALAQVPCELITVVLDWTEVQPPAVSFRCPLCSAELGGPIPEEVAYLLLNGGAQLAAAQPLEAL